MECFKCGLRGYTSRNIEDSGAKNDLNCEYLAEEDSEKNIHMWPRNNYCHIFDKECDYFMSLYEKYA